MSIARRVSELKPHPVLCELIPPLSDEEFQSLKDDIQTNGVQYAVWAAQADGGLVLIDGHHRHRAACELGIAEIPVNIKYGAGEHEIIERGLSLNANRRHWTREQKRALVESLLKRWPTKSDRHIGRLAGVHHETVASVRATLEGRGEFRHAETRTDSVGRQQPAAKPRTSENATLRLVKTEKLPGGGPAAAPEDEVHLIVFDGQLVPVEYDAPEHEDVTAPAVPPVLKAGIAERISAVRSSAWSKLSAYIVGIPIIPDLSPEQIREAVNDADFDPYVYARAVDRNIAFLLQVQAATAKREARSA